MKRWLTLGLLVGLLVGCRSTRLAIPLPLVASVAEAPRRAVALPIDSAGVSVTNPPLLPAAPLPSAPPPIRARSLGPDKSVYSRQAGLARGQLGKSTAALAVTVQTDAPPQTGLAWGGILQVIGTGLFIGGMVAGLLVGGWAGFGLFLLGSVVGGFVAFCGSFLIDGQLP